LRPSAVKLTIPTTDLSCFREWNHCTEATASHYPKGYISVDRTLWEIERWDEFEIVSKPNDSAFCTRYVLRIDKLQKAVFKQRTTKSDDGLCQGINKKDLRIRLVDGFDVWSELNKKYYEKTKKVIRGDLLLGEFPKTLRKQ